MEASRPAQHPRLRENPVPASAAAHAVQPGELRPGELDPDLGLGLDPDDARAPHFEEDDFFGLQPSPTSALPDPRDLLQNLACCVIEILAGAREPEQVARWVSDDVYRHLLKRVIISTRARRARGQRVVRPAFTVGPTLTCEPRDGVVEAVVVMRGRQRTRVVAVRLEGLDSRWRATALTVL